LKSPKRRRSPFDKAARFFGELKALGCLFSLDDFGAGMSSFGYLKHLPVDFIKIDGSFVKDVADDAVDFTMVRAINDVGHAMGKKTIGEFVSTRRGWPRCAGSEWTSRKATGFPAESVPDPVVAKPHSSRIAEKATRILQLNSAVPASILNSIT